MCIGFRSSHSHHLAAKMARCNNLCYLFTANLRQNAAFHSPASRECCLQQLHSQLSNTHCCVSIRCVSIRSVGRIAHVPRVPNLLYCMCVMLRILTSQHIISTITGGLDLSDLADCGAHRALPTPRRSSLCLICSPGVASATGAERGRGVGTRRWTRARGVV